MSNTGKQPRSNNYYKKRCPHTEEKKKLAASLGGTSYTLIKGDDLGNGRKKRLPHSLKDKKSGD